MTDVTIVTAAVAQDCWMLSLLQRRKTEQTPGGTAADISGSVSDSQLAIGEHIVQNNIAAGAIVNQIAGQQGPIPPRARDKPVSVKPREPPRLVGRDKELVAATSALAAREPVQFSGRAGAGKTAMLRHLAHGTVGAFPDGVIYYRSRSESLDDLLLRIFEFLYACEERLKPTSAELCLYLEDTQALLLLDDVDLEREDLETLLLTLPRSVFVFGSPERSLWCDGTAIGLRGLGDDAALMLVEQYLGRPLASHEAGDFAALCRALDGQPLQIIKAVSQVREEGVPASELVPSGKPFPSAPEQLGAQIVETLTPEARQALMLMAALGGAPLHTDHVAAMTGSRDTAALLADLEERGLAKSHSPRYSVTDAIAALRPTDAESRWRRQLLTYFAEHAEAHAAQPQRLRDDLEPIIATLRSGASAGDWRAVLRLARAADPIAAASKLWGAWATILGIALDAARRLGEQAQEAWALHQLGTRALCLGDADEARRRLGEALRIRERIGDRAAEITRHNMRHLPGAPPPSRPPAGPAGTSPWIAPLCAGIVALAVGGGLIATSLGDDGRTDATPVANGGLFSERVPEALREGGPVDGLRLPRTIPAGSPHDPGGSPAATPTTPAIPQSVDEFE
ncbi:MAG TPA: tetratricopeptide repeat protein, partial [Solirubrobacteraceae bacterium]|nr:tetratricopeptide repeat protein [Solirubrobacteraceae bacterium]